MDGSSPRGGILKSRPGAIPMSVVSLTVFHTCLLVAYSLLLPTYRAPDEPHHVDMIRKVRASQTYPDLGTTFISEQVVASLSLVDFAGRSRHLAAGDAPSREQRPTFAELGPNRQSAHMNQMPQHPPLYYVVAAIEAAAISRYVPGLRGAAFDVEVALYRLLNLLFVAPLPLLAFLTARRLRLTTAGCVTAAAIPVSIPMLTHVGASVTNDNLLNLLFALTFLLMAGVWRGDGRRMTALIAGGVVALAMLTKAFALVLIVVLTLSYVVGYLRTRARKVAASGVLALAVASAGGGWWWLRNLVVHGAVVPASGIIREGPSDFDLDRPWWIANYLDLMNSRFWGWFGWVDVRLPEIALLIPLLVVLGGVASALLRRAEDGPDRVELLLLLFPIAALLTLVGWNSYGYYVEDGIVDRGIQGRYLFPGVIGGAVVVATGYARLLGRYRDALPVIAVVAVVVMHVVAVGKLLHAFWGPPSAPWLGKFDALVAWSPWPSVTVWLVSMLTVFAGSAVLVTTARRTWRAFLRARSGSPALPHLGSTVRYTDETTKM